MLLSDLFKKTGHDFDWDTRVSDQDKLMERLKETGDLELLKISQDLARFVEDGRVASMNYVEYLLTRITKVASRKNISIE